MRSVENEECTMRSVENEECGKCGVWKVRSVKKSVFHFSFISLMSVKNEACVIIWKVTLIL